MQNIKLILRLIIMVIPKITAMRTGVFNELEVSPEGKIVEVSFIVELRIFSYVIHSRFNR